MKRRAGFTLIELLVTITVMVILLTLGVASFSTYQASARDEERKTDVQAITQQLESFYEADHIGASGFATGVYPTTTAMDTEAEIKTALPNLDVRSLRDPVTPVTSSVSLVVASSASTPTLASLNSGKTYIYQPLSSSNTLCTSTSQECRKFNLYYTLETDLTIKTITSKHQ